MNFLEACGRMQENSPPPIVDVKQDIVSFVIYHIVPRAQKELNDLEGKRKAALKKYNKVLLVSPRIFNSTDDNQHLNLVDDTKSID